MMSTNLEKNSAVSEEGHVLKAYFFFGRKLGQYADQELLKYLFQKKKQFRTQGSTYILIQVYDQQGQQ